MSKSVTFAGLRLIMRGFVVITWHHKVPLPQRLLQEGRREVSLKAERVGRGEVERHTHTHTRKT